jgi:hypothetical protein
MRSLNRFAAPLGRPKGQGRGRRYFFLRASFKTIAIGACAWASSILFLCAAGDVLNEATAKIQFIHYVAQYAVWPKEALAPGDKQFVIGVLGENPFGEALEDYFKSRTVKGRQFVVKIFKEVEEVKNCQILFISASEKGKLTSILKKLEDTSILTISDTEGFVQKDGMIFIYIVPKSEITSGLAWEINPQVMKREKLQIDPFFIERARKPNH